MRGATKRRLCRTLGLGGVPPSRAPAPFCPGPSAGNCDWRQPCTPLNAHNCSLPTSYWLRTNCGRSLTTDPHESGRSSGPSASEDEAVGMAV